MTPQSWRFFPRRLDLVLLAPALLLVGCSAAEPTDPKDPHPVERAAGPQTPAAQPPAPQVPAPATPQPSPPVTQPDPPVPPSPAEEARSTKARVAVLAPAGEAGAAAQLAHTAFALDLARSLRVRGGNQVFSPASVSIALAMAAAGARGETAAGMGQALRRPVDRLHADLGFMEAELGKRGQDAAGTPATSFDLHLANRVWAQRNYHFEAAFLDTLAENYGAGVGLVDFIGATEPARATINAWVSARTASRVRELIPTGVLGAETRMVLTNAVYLHAPWAFPFAPEETAPGTFIRDGGGHVQVAFMRKATKLAAAAGDGWVAASLPLQDQRLSMVIIVPDPGTFAGFANRLDAAGLTQILAALAARDTLVLMPRFKFETAVSLKDSLGQLGMARAFDPNRADFSGINGVSAGAEKLFIGDVVHTAFVGVTERGVEAAAATAVEFGAGATPPPQVPPLLVSASRPFLFVLRDQPTGAILFIGHVLDPSVTSGD